LLRNGKKKNQLFCQTAVSGSALVYI